MQFFNLNDQKNDQNDQNFPNTSSLSILFLQLFSHYSYGINSWRKYSYSTPYSNKSKHYNLGGYEHS